MNRKQDEITAKLILMCLTAATAFGAGMIILIKVMS
jgi:hypothetical protein